MLLYTPILLPLEPFQHCPQGVRFSSVPITLYPCPAIPTSPNSSLLVLPSLLSLTLTFHPSFIGGAHPRPMRVQPRRQLRHRVVFLHASLSQAPVVLSLSKLSPTPIISSRSRINSILMISIHPSLSEQSPFYLVLLVVRPFSFDHCATSLPDISRAKTSSPSPLRTWKHYHSRLFPS
jgi:hypothetical protein